MNTARKALRESRTMSLRRSLEAGGSLAGTPGASADVEAAVAASAARGAAAQEAVDDLESSLLLGDQNGTPPMAVPQPAAEPSGGGSVVGSLLSCRPSLTDPAYQQHRDSRQLWRMVRANLGLSHREADDGHATVERTAVGVALHPSPSWQRAQSGDEEEKARNIADTFVRMLAGKGLGTGLALRSDSSLLARHVAPGMWAPRGDAKAVWHMLTSSFLNIMLLALPLGIWAGMKEGNPTLVFTANFAALIPLALFLGEVTEDLAVRFGDTIGGLLNATFGNVVELILSIAALQRGLYTVVATSLIGSILSNLLLVLGMCFFFGGLKYKEQRFSTLANKMSSSLLFLACIAIIIPSTAKLIYGPTVISKDVLFNLSHAIAIVLVFIYVGYLFFQLKTHADFFAGEESEETPALSLSGAVACLVTITLIVAVCSEYLTGAIEAVSESSGINQAFLGLIVLPIAGNAAEHITAVFVAVKDKMDLSIAVALGSSIQIAVFLIPVVVLAGWAMGRDFTLDFDAFAVLMLTVSVILAYMVASDGTSNWLLGLQLVATYCLVAFVFLLEHEPANVALDRWGRK
ncbi:calcium proton exchanger [Micractinium conductrix]|uniref:Vacuolar cation/proton exchanger n=1 Tax=Micractinium conductrix TaxID=554055 RepID=A0A2P6VCV8_9CHLO|nr:calcium proton exchanger [Micractinium conductrix]|eukprot:PSC71917.1 calcium proton exchanger [Micractinium conductrix]